MKLSRSDIVISLYYKISYVIHQHGYIFDTNANDTHLVEVGVRCIQLSIHFVQTNG